MKIAKNGLLFSWQLLSECRALNQGLASLNLIHLTLFLTFRMNEMSFIHKIISLFILYIIPTPLAKISLIHPPSNTRQFSILSHPQASRQLLQKGFYKRNEKWQTLRQVFKAIACILHLRKTNSSHLPSTANPPTPVNQCNK
jgi:hypothetical protein